MPLNGIARTLLKTGLCVSVVGGIIANAGRDAQAQSKINVTTYHYDNLRTGWNPKETFLTPATVGGANFGLIATTALDGQVDAQPLIVTGLTINGGLHDVAYLATENNTIYAIDAATGTILLQRNLGTPVPMTVLPGSCSNNANTVGINGTPVIDLSNNILYVVVYDLEGANTNQPTHRLFALDVASLTDRIPSVVVAATHTLSDGTTLFKFNSTVQRQRPGLILANGNVYAAFGSFCDLAVNVSRGWLLGWKPQLGMQPTLTPLANNRLVDQWAEDPMGHSYYLSSIWMSGFAPSADASGNIYFVTGNSDSGSTTSGLYGPTSYSPPINLQEFAVKLTPNLTTVLDYFTPGGPNGVNYLDQHDFDFGSGGITLLPDQQPGPLPNQPWHLAIAAGKTGIMYLLNRENMGHYLAAGPDQVLGSFTIGDCFCGQSYFTGADGVGRIVSSGNLGPQIWQIVPSTNSVALIKERSLAVSGPFTSVSSNGVKTNTAVIWSVARGKTVYMEAADPTTGKIIVNASAGTWPYSSAGANIVPVVANGRVYVASYQNLSIFGLAPHPAPALKPGAVVAPVVTAADVIGTITVMDGSLLTVETGAGNLVRIDAAAAQAAYLSVPLYVGELIAVTGKTSRSGVVSAEVILHAQSK